MLGYIHGQINRNRCCGDFSSSSNWLQTSEPVQSLANFRHKDLVKPRVLVSSEDAVFACVFSRTQNIFHYLQRYRGEIRRFEQSPLEMSNHPSGSFCLHCLHRQLQFPLASKFYCNVYILCAGHNVISKGAAKGLQIDSLIS